MNFSPVISRQIAEFNNSPEEDRQSFYEKNHDPVALKNEICSLDIPLQEESIDLNDFKNWQETFSSLTSYYAGILEDVYIEKLLEHYLTFTYLEITNESLMIDVAAAGSPWAKILAEAGIRSYQLDLLYSPGIHGNEIGADATATGLPDSFATAITLHCAFETFMGDDDKKFIPETHRILAPGGRFAITPVYLDSIHINITSPYCDQAHVVIDKEAKKIWRDDPYKEKFSRHYSPQSFKERFFSPLDKLFTGTFLYFKNLEEVRQAYPGQRVYNHFMFMGKKIPS